MTLPREYQWLSLEPGPKMLLEFLGIYGTKEVLGPGDNPIIIQWAKELGLKDYQHDETAWCGLAMAVVAKRAGKELPPANPLWALNWALFGNKVTDGPKLGDVLVFKRQGGGHVTLYVGEDEGCYHCLGGNQSDMVNIVRKAKDRLYAVRRPVYIHQPLNVRKVFLSPTGAIDDKES